jgi:hypothetical protein
MLVKKDSFPSNNNLVITSKVKFMKLYHNFLILFQKVKRDKLLKNKK